MTTEQSKKRILFPFFLGLVRVATIQFEARADLRLTDSIKSALAAAQIIHGDRFDCEMFKGKPLLVVFFASWWGAYRCEFA